MSAFDWVQILVGVRYCLRRAIAAASLLLANKIKPKLIVPEGAKSSE